MAEGNGKELNTKATVVGGGVGTLLVTLAGQIAPHHPTLSSVLTYAAPAVSVAGTAAWVFLAGVAKRWRSRSITDSALKRARQMRDQICSDPSATDGHKHHARATVEHFERLSMAMLKSEFESVDAQFQA